MAGTDMVGAVMVVGGGVGGMQAALDLAESGFKVYLVESDTAIGGRMAQLDKTFPTNDCAMCIVSPKLVEIGRHPAIEIMTRTTVAGLEGEAGHFTVKLRREPRFVDLQKCTGCGECAQVCPIERPNEYNRSLSTRRAIFKRYPQAIPGAYAIEKAGAAPCRLACPAGVSVQGYVKLISLGKYQEALDLIRRDNPFPAICGRVCTRPCELACRRTAVEEAIAIRDLKRFVADIEMRSGVSKLPGPKVKRPQAVAVIGAGPAGLTAAYYLRREGYKVTIFESKAYAGGMMASGIPEYRLPRTVLRWEIEAILSTGIQVAFGTRLGRDIQLQELFHQGFDAVFLATGAPKGIRLGIEGEELEGVRDGLSFLSDFNWGRRPKLGKRVAVVGGGNSAMDAARVARRCGAEEVVVLYRRTREEMPADPEEIEEAADEGVDFLFLKVPVRVVGEGSRLAGIECLDARLGEPDESGRRRPEPIEGSAHVIPVDDLIVAIGQHVDLGIVTGIDGTRLAPRGKLVASQVTYETGVAGVFAGGDLLTGARTVVEAVAAGKEAALSIHRYLQGDEVAVGRGKRREKAVASIEGVAKQPRQRPPQPEELELRRDLTLEVRLPLTEAQARAEASRCLSCGVCCECYRCVEACKAGAIDHTQMPKDVEVSVGSIILAPGFEQLDAAKVGEHGFGVAKNVVTSLDLERLLSATGPTGGHVERPSDGVVPKRIAWLQCVGSRDVRHGQDHCSSVCCMFTAKQAIITKEHHPEVEATVFAMDVRAHGKGFDAYYERARDRYGVRYVRSQVSRVREMPDTGELVLRYADESGEMTEETFDLVVLSTGIRPSASAAELAERLGVETDAAGFARTTAFDPVATNVPGIFVCGLFQGPKDIPETVAQASGAASRAAGTLAEARGTMVASREFPAEKGVEGGARVGVVVCRCGINIAGVVDVPGVVDFAKDLPGVVHCGEALFACSQDNQERLKALVEEHDLNRLVVASCSPRTHEPLFQLTLREAKLNPFLFSMANIRDQCSWVHGSNRDAATAKAKDLVRMAVANAQHLSPLRVSRQPVTARALVVGGGLAGMSAALRIAENGHEVTLVERSARLGGGLSRLDSASDGTPVRPKLEALRAEVMASPAIEVLLEAEVVESAGFIGSFVTTVEVGAGRERHEVRHGVTVVAVGATERRPAEYLYGQDPRVLTQLELEERLSSGLLEDGGRPASVVMIQCVGSRGEERPYCSRVCCTQAVKNALRIKEAAPEARVVVLYRDVRTYGLHERLYARARAAGVLFVRYDVDQPPVVGAGGERLQVTVAERTLGKEVAFPADLVVLASAIVPREDERRLYDALKLQTTAEGFLLEAHAKLRPVDMATDGVFIAGLAHGPKPLDETLAQAAAAASRACTILSRPYLEVGGVVSKVDPERCAACLCCVRACPYGVPAINEEGVAEIAEALCRGCGLCAAECPGKAIELQYFTDAQVLEVCRALSPD